jgi:hypothetical protein
MSWREQYEERLANLANLTPDQLTELESELIGEFDSIDDQNGSLTDLNEISQEISRVRDQATTSASSLAEMRANVHPAEDTSPDGEPDGDNNDDDQNADNEDAEPVTPEPAPATAVVPARSEVQPIAAAAPRRPALGTLARRTTAVPATRNGNSDTVRVTTRLVAAGDIPGFGVGQEITTNEQLSMALVRKLEALGRGGTPDDVLVASMVKQFPESRMLGIDPYVNSAKIDAVVRPKAMIAYGGICEPVSIDYSIDTIGSTDRPIRNSLPTFGASRGGVTFFTPPVLSAITPPVPWTLAEDVAGTATKACMTIDCATSQTAYVYGVPVCVQVGNMAGRFSPEHVAAQVALLDVATARMAELTLLNIIDAGSTALTYAGPVSATRDFLTMLDEAVAAYGTRYRLGETPLRMIAPDWLTDLFRADLTREIAHDRDGQNNLATTDAQLGQLISARNVNPTWTMEDLANSMGGAQAAGVLNKFPGTFVVYLFAEGTWQFLDGGRIDVGVVRDSALNATNDYQIWREDFEGLAMRGVESLKITVTTKPTGASVGTLDPTTVVPAA